MRLFIFQPGRWNERDYGEDFVKALIAQYDPSNDWEAPLVVGHGEENKESELAHGWVESLEVDEDYRLYAVIRDVSEEVVAWIKKRQLRYVSIEWVDRSGEVEEISPYLLRVALLGRNAPAIPTTEIDSDQLSRTWTHAVKLSWKEQNYKEQHMKEKEEA